MIEQSETNKEYGFLSEAHAVFPPMVIVEINNVCNLECIHCPYRFISRQKDYSPRYMSWDLYKKIVDEVSRYPGVIFRLLCDGEPLMHPRFTDMISLAKGADIGPVNFITNGMFLDEKTARAVLGVGVEAVEISLDALHKETYEKIRKGADYDLVIENTRRFIALRNQLQAPTKILVSIIDQAAVREEIDEFISYWEPQVDRVVRRTFTTIGGLIDDPATPVDTSGKRWPCPQLWRRFFITVDGRAEFCVEDWHDKTIVGNLAESDIRRIWNSPEYKKVRRLHLEGRFAEIPHCRSCRDWKSRDWEYNYFYIMRDFFGAEEKQGAGCR